MAYKSTRQTLFEDEIHRHYTQLIDNLPVAVCIQTYNRIEFINPAGTRLFGAAKPAELIGKSVADFVHPDSVKIVKEQFQQAIEGLEVPPIEEKIIRLDRNVIDVEITPVPFLYQNIPSVLILFYVITRRKRMYDLQTALNTILQISLKNISLKETLEQIIDQIVSIPWLSLESKGAIFLVEDKPEVLVLNAQRGLPLSLQSTCAAVPFGRCLCGRTASSGKVVFADHVDDRHDNRYAGIIPHGHYCVPIVSNEKVLGVINTYIKSGHPYNPREEEFLLAIANVLVGIIHRKRAEDEIKKAKNELEIRVKERTATLVKTNEDLQKEIAERWQAEKALRESEDKFKKLSREFNVLLDAITDNLVLLSPDLKIMWTNKAAAAVFGKNIFELSGQYCHKICCNVFTPCENCPAIMCFITGKEESAQVTNHNGRLWDIRAFPIKDDLGRVKNVIEIASDVTEKTSLQAEAAKNKHLASLGELAAGVAHEINNPINNIINYAQILHDEFEEEKRNNNIPDRIIRDGDRIAMIVRSLLSFARIRKEEKSFVDINEICSDILPLIAAQIQKEGINLRVNTPSDIPKIYVQPQQIQQVFLNLISNSRYALNEKYPEPHKNKTIEITCEKISDRKNPRVRITFYDRGTGIPAEILDKVIDPFFTTKSCSMGTGIGLSISHGIISEHGGKLLINSVQGEFTKVIIELPVTIEA